MKVERPSFLLYGFFGGWNSGDEVILETVAAATRSLVSGGATGPGETATAASAEASPDTEPTPDIVIVSNRFSETATRGYDERGWRTLSVRSPLAIFRVLRNRRTIVGGGQMMTGDRKYRGLILLWMIVAMARRRGRPAWMVGIGVEGVHRPLAKWWCRRIVAASERVCCRDDYSLEMLRAAGCDSRKLCLSADVVFSGLATRKPEESRPGDPSIAIGLHQSPVRTYSAVDTTLQLIASLREAFPDHRLVCVSNDCRPRFDDGMIESLQRSVQDTKVAFQKFRSAAEVQRTYAGAECVVSVRMHPLIMAAMSGSRCVGIAGSNKVHQLAERLGFRVVEDIERVAESVAAAIQEPRPDIRDLQSLALRDLRSAVAGDTVG